MINIFFVISIYNFYVQINAFQSRIFIAYYAISPSYSKLVHRLHIDLLKYAGKLSAFDCLNKCTRKGLLEIFCRNSIQNSAIS